MCLAVAFESYENLNSEFRSNCQTPTMTIKAGRQL